MKKKSPILRAFWIFIFAVSANSGVFISKNKVWIVASIALLLAVNILAGMPGGYVKKKWLRGLSHGLECLYIFTMSVMVSAFYHILILIIMPSEGRMILVSILVSYIAHFILFWNGIICVYLTSYQLGIKHRIIGAVCGPIPILHLFALGSILRIVSKETELEKAKERVNSKREKDAVCKTKYPVLLVHGVFFRDTKLLNYWGRIPEELIRNGAYIYYGNHQSALGVKDSAGELCERIKEIVRETGCEKVNVIAHSKGGLDTRYAIAKLDAAPYIASLTTVNTPHRGCSFADDLLSKIPEKIQDSVAAAYNSAARRLGDTSPDFMAAVRDLTASACSVFDKELTVPEGIYCQSIGSVLKGARGGKFPLNFTHPMVKKHDGENDGLVSVDSFSFGESVRILTPPKTRGISHGDVIDLNRENIEGFDVRELYVELVSDLRKKGF